MLRRQEIKAVTFDVGGTLIAPHPSIGDVYAQVAERHGRPGLSPEILERRFHQAWQAATSFQHSRDDWQRLVDEVFDGLVPAPPSATFFPDLYDEFGRAAAWRIFDDVLPTLEALAVLGLDLGVISNWDERLRPLLRDLRLHRYFNCVVVSCEAGFAKPSPVIFHEALRHLGRSASAVLHVGDALNEDFAGATAAGLSALHLRRDSTPAALQVRSLQDVVAALESR